MSADERARAMYERHLKGKRDAIMREDWAREEGIEQGVKQGLEQGERQKQVEITRRLLDINDPIDKIAAVTGLTLQEVEAIRNAERIQSNLQ
jgi:predicted transposase/invertase (TIGR01784 family)